MKKTSYDNYYNFKDIMKVKIILNVMNKGHFGFFYMHFRNVLLIIIAQYSQYFLPYDTMFLEIKTELFIRK